MSQANGTINESSSSEGNDSIHINEPSYDAVFENIQQMQHDHENIWEKLRRFGGRLDGMEDYVMKRLDSIEQLTKERVNVLKVNEQLASKFQEKIFETVQKLAEDVFKCKVDMDFYKERMPVPAVEYFSKEINWAQEQIKEVKEELQLQKSEVFPDIADLISRVTELEKYIKSKTIQEEFMRKAGKKIALKMIADKDESELTPIELAMKSALDIPFQELTLDRKRFETDKEKK